MFLKLSFRNKAVNQHGDTLVEVLMCIAIVAAVIAGAYALASRSLAEGISASEHSIAIKLAEGQVEALKSRQKDALTRTTDLWVPNFENPPADRRNFCLDITSPSMLDAAGNPNVNWLPQLNNGGGAFTGDNVVVGTAGQPNTYKAICTDTPTVAANAKYFINIKVIPITGKKPTYLVTVKWKPAGAGPISQTQIYYRF